MLAVKGRALLDKKSHEPLLFVFEHSNAIREDFIPESAKIALLRAFRLWHPKCLNHY